MRSTCLAERRTNTGSANTALSFRLWRLGSCRTFLSAWGRHMCSPQLPYAASRTVYPHDEGAILLILTPGRAEPEQRNTTAGLHYKAEQISSHRCQTNFTSQIDLLQVFILQVFPQQRKAQHEICEHSPVFPSAASCYI